VPCGQNEVQGEDVNKTLLLSSCCALIAIAAAPGSASAQSNPGGQQAEAATLGEVIVTAQRRSERLQDVPISITNVTAEQLKDANIQNLAAIQKVTPALRFDNQGPFYQPTIRGVGSAIVTSGSGSNVGIYVDGFYSPNPEAADLQLLNVENVQVLKGPQGTLFGRNTTGGAILVTTGKPSKTPGGMVDVSYGNYNTLRYEAYGATGIGDHVAVDAAYVNSQGDGWQKNIFTHDDKVGAYRNWSIRTGVNVDVTDDISVLFRYAHHSTNDPTSMENNSLVQNGQVLNIGAVIPGALVATRPDEVSRPLPVGFEARSDVFQLTPRFELPFGTLTSYTQYRREDGTFHQDAATSAPVFYGVIPVEDRTFSQEFLLTSKPGPRLQWTAGAFYLDYRDSFAANISQGGGPIFRAASSYSDTVTEAVYLDLTYQLLDKLFVTAGARYSHDEVRHGWFEIANTGRVYAPTLKGDKVTPRFVLRYAFDPETSAYASFTRGYKAGIYNLGGASLVPVQPEKITAYEVGFKHAERKFSVNAAAYYYDYTNLQVASYGLINSVPVSEITNAATSRVYGVEADGRYRVTDDFEVNASAAYTHARYRHFPNAPGFVVAGGPAGGPIEGTIVDASGRSMQRAPDFTATAGARYTVDLAGGKLVLSGTLYHSSEVFFDTAAEVSQKPYNTLGLRVAWTDPSDRYTVALYGDNVTGTRYLTQAEPSVPLAVLTNWSAPAMFAGEIRARFP
jgi:iron complex outermembrane receptor protein